MSSLVLSFSLGPDWKNFQTALVIASLVVNCKCLLMPLPDAGGDDLAGEPPAHPSGDGDAADCGMLKSEAQLLEDAAEAVRKVSHGAAIPGLAAQPHPAARLSPVAESATRRKHLPSSPTDRSRSSSLFLPRRILRRAGRPRGQPEAARHGNLQGRSSLVATSTPGPTTWKVRAMISMVLVPLGPAPPSPPTAGVAQRCPGWGLTVSKGARSPGVGLADLRVATTRRPRITRRPVAPPMQKTSLPPTLQ